MVIDGTVFDGNIGGTTVTSNAQSNTFVNSKVTNNINAFQILLMSSTPFEKIFKIRIGNWQGITYNPDMIGFREDFSCHIPLVIIVIIKCFSPCWRYN